MLCLVLASCFGCLDGIWLPAKRACLIAFASLLIPILGAAPAHAEKRSAVVMVSVQVVESCRITAVSSQDGSVNLNMRCSSTAHPAIGLPGGTQALSPVGTVALPSSRIATSPSGKTLAIEF